MASFYDEALKADEVEIKETLTGFVSPVGNGSFTAVLSHLADLAKGEREQAVVIDTRTEKLEKNLFRLEGKIREVTELAKLLRL